MNYFRFLLLFTLLFNFSYSKDTKNILLLSSYHQTLPWSMSHINGVKEFINKQNDYNVNLYEEYFETIRLNSNFNEKHWFTHLKNKYKNKKFDAIIADSFYAVNFVQKYDKELYNNIPIVMFGNNINITKLEKNKLLFQTEIKDTVLKTIKIATIQNPRSKQIVIIENDENDSKNLSNAIKKVVKEIKEYKIKSLYNLSLKDYKKTISKLDNNSILIFTLISKDKDKSALIPKHVVKELSKVSNIPIYVLYSTLIGNGVLGGFVVDAKTIGYSMSEAAFDYIKNNTYKKSYKTNQTILDYEVMKKYDLLKIKIPFDTKFINKTPTIFETNKNEVIIIVSFLLITISLLIYLYILNKRSSKSKNIIKNIIDTAPVRIFWKDKNGKFLGANKLFLEDAKLEKEDEIIGKSDLDMHWKEDAYFYIQDDKKVMDLKIPKLNYEETQTSSDGEKKYLVTSKVPLIEKGKVFGIVGVYNDVTEHKLALLRLKENEKYIFEKEKLASMGEMIGNIAHQWRQPLSVISVAASGMQLKYDMNLLTKEEMEEFNKNIIDSTNFLSSTIDTFRNYIKEEKIFKEIIIQETIKESLEIINTTLKNKYIKLIDNVDYSKEIKIKLIAGELSQVFLNLINNSKDAILEKKINNAWIKIDLEDLGEKIIISIEDNAGGIPDDIIMNIFEPYFTTKHKSVGTGLGLYMSKEIIEKHLKGKLYVKNTKNGAIFYIELILNHN